MILPPGHTHESYAQNCAETAHELLHAGSLHLIHSRDAAAFKDLAILLATCAEVAKTTGASIKRWRASATTRTHPET